MKASISANVETNELTITIQGVNLKALEAGNFHQSELIVREVVNLIGGELTADLMRNQEVEVERLELEGKTYYRKEASAGHYQTRYGEQVVERHLYRFRVVPMLLLASTAQRTTARVGRRSIMD